jgi:cysteine desulfurase
MTDTMKHIYANPSAVHRLGVESHNLLANARKTIADSLGAHSDEIIFTSGGTESDNLAISGVVNAYYQSHTAKPHIITSTIEHAAVLETIRHLEQTGVIEATYVPVDERGLIDMKYLKESLKQRTILVSIIHGNNEIGVIQNIADVAKIVRHFKKNKTTSPQPTPEQEMELDVYPLVHTDACQSYVYMKLVVKKLGIDLITINSSKIYGPKGTGALYKKPPNQCPGANPNF